VLFQAKALAEKNMRDLLAQREQAERNVKIFLNNHEKYKISKFVCICN
jgi:hypothetical protein